MVLGLRFFLFRGREEAVVVLDMERPKRRYSQQRQAVLEAVRESCSHPTADELFEWVRERLPRISLGTVYRNLEVLVKDGSILRIDGAGGQRRYDRSTQTHCHIRCATCGRVEDVDGADWVLRLRDLALKTDFEVEDVSVCFLGTCPDCRGRSSGGASGSTRAGFRSGEPEGKGKRS